MPGVPNAKQEIFIGLIVCVVVLTLYPNIHISLFLSFAWMIYFIYKNGRKIVSDYLDEGIKEIKTSIDNLETEKNNLQIKIDGLKNEISDSERSYSIAIKNAKVEAQAYYDKKMLEIDNKIKEMDVKNKNILQSIEDEYVELIKHRITDLIVENLIVEMNDPRKVKNVTLSGISRAVSELQKLGSVK